jgi:membrane protease subunit HflK
MYLETMQQILSGMNKVIVDQRGGQGVVPVLPLPGMTGQPAQGGTVVPSTQLRPGGSTGAPQ